MKTVNIFLILQKRTQQNRKSILSKFNDDLWLSSNTGLVILIGQKPKRL